MYQEFYRLADAPFRLLPDPRFFYGSRVHCRALAYMRYGIQQGEGFVVITGPVGTGKSLLAAQLLGEIDTEAVVPACVATTQVGAEDALRLISEAFRAPTIGAGKAGLIQGLRAFLESEREAGRRVLLLVDEAQNLPRETLEELRMLSNMERHGEPLLQCFLLGQPQFAATLAVPALEQLRQRVIASCSLEPMAEAENRAYIEHRMATAGWAGDPAITDDAFRRIHRATGGIPRCVNTLCNRVLFFGAIEGLHEIDEADVETVVRDLEAETETALPQPSSPGDGAHASETEARLASVEQALLSQQRLIRELLRDTADRYRALSDACGELPGAAAGRSKLT